MISVIHYILWLFRTKQSHPLEFLGYFVFVLFLFVLLLPVYLHTKLSSFLDNPTVSIAIFLGGIFCLILF